MSKILAKVGELTVTDAEVAEFIAIGPGVICDMATMSVNSAFVIH